jgi:hypothetical protein
MNRRQDEAPGEGVSWSRLVEQTMSHAVGWLRGLNERPVAPPVDAERLRQTRRAASAHRDVP